MKSAEIRKTFLDFFKNKGHQVVPSAPIVIKNDPSLLFTNAGMNQFKDYFLGNKPAPFPRIADTQKCLRVSGKHNDLEEVGVDTYHHTMFEMLGNWSFGDYFKQDAINWSWELLTEVYGLDKDKLYVTVFEGYEKDGLPKDDEAYNFWKAHLPEDRILMGNKKDNFWEMGDVGPCGPCTEIHVDCRSEEERKAIDGKTLVNNDHPQVIEIWNNVFIQYNRMKDGSLDSLPQKHVDTGMGLERLVRVLQQKNSNYDTDLFSGTIIETEILCGKAYGGSDEKPDVAFRVIADHIRAIAFTIADGQLPSNTGAGYVVRRILRRAVRYYFSYLGVNQPLLHKLLPVLAAQFEDVFPELKQQLDFIQKVVQEEENNFLRTLDLGLKRLDNITAQNKKSGQIGGKEAFELYDTYGFPLDLTRLIAQEQQMEVDEFGFQEEMQLQKTRSRAAGTIDTEDWAVLGEGSSSFVGYDQLEAKTHILRYRKITVKGKEAFQIVLKETPFYAESGGQVGDTGYLQIGEEKITIFDTKKENDLIVHFASHVPTATELEVTAHVDTFKRKHTAIHHSATHLLHAALREVLGIHVAQKGSLVNSDNLRFDFSHFSKVSDEEIIKIEELVNQKIRENILVVIKEMNKDEAMKMGAMALFGEKYGDHVRVVIMDHGYSVELCGGTHVGNTGELGFFKIINETAVAAGVRRMEAVSGWAAEQFIQKQVQALSAAKIVLKNPKDLVKGIESLLDENTRLNKRIEKLEARKLSEIKNTLLEKVQSINGINFLGEVVEVPSADALKKLCFDLKANLQNFLVVLASDIEGKPAVAVMIDESLSHSKGWEAPKIIKEYISPLINGGGGGQKTLATAGGQDASKLAEVIEKVKSLI